MTEVQERQEVDRDLKIAFLKLVGKRERNIVLWDYYWGKHPLRYSSARLEEMFGALDVRFVENWCGVVIDSTMDRLNLAGFHIPGDETTSKKLNDEYQRTELTLESDDAHLAALVTGEAFIIIWPDEEGKTEAYYNDPRLCHIEYYADKPRKKRFAAKLWEDEEGKASMFIYYPERIRFFRSEKPFKDVVNPNELIHRYDDANPTGEVPVFHLRRDRIRIWGELDGIITLQDAVNKLLSDMMVAAEYGAFPQRYIITNAKTAELKSSPGLVWEVPSGDGKTQKTEVGQLASTELSNYLAGIQDIAQSMAVITRTPRHYFWGQQGPISGEALYAMEAPLNKKIERYIERFSSVWRQIARFIMKLNGVELEELNIILHWTKPDTVQPRTQAEIRQLSVVAGMPLITVLRREGWSKAELEQLLKDMEDYPSEEVSPAVTDVETHGDEDKVKTHNEPKGTLEK